MTQHVSNLFYTKLEKSLAQLRADRAPRDLGDRQTIDCYLSDKPLSYLLTQPGARDDIGVISFAFRAERLKYQGEWHLVWSLEGFRSA